MKRITEALLCVAIIALVSWLGMRAIPSLGFQSPKPLYQWPACVQQRLEDAGRPNCKLVYTDVKPRGFVRYDFKDGPQTITVVVKNGAVHTYQEWVK